MLGRAVEDTITLTVQWENLESGNQAIAVYTASWASPPADVHSQQRFFAMCHKGEVTVDQAHRGYTTATDAAGFASLNPLFWKPTPSSGKFVGQGGYGYRSIESFVEAVHEVRAGKSKPADFNGSLATLGECAWRVRLSDVSASRSVLLAGLLRLLSPVSPPQRPQGQRSRRLPCWRPAGTRSTMPAARTAWCTRGRAPPRMQRQLVPFGLSPPSDHELGRAVHRGSLGGAVAGKLPTGSSEGAVRLPVSGAQVAPAATQSPRAEALSARQLRCRKFASGGVMLCSGCAGQHGVVRGAQTLACTPLKGLRGRTHETRNERW